MSGSLALAGQAPAADAVAARLTCQGFEVTRLGAAGLPSDPEVFFRDLRTALVVARDIADFERVLRRRIMTLPGVGQVEANVLLTEEARPGPRGGASQD